MSTPKPQPPASLAQAQQPPLPSASASAGLTQLEQQLLEEYTKLLQNLHRVRYSLPHLPHHAIATRGG